MRHMELKDRYFIEKALKKKMSVKEIAETLGFSKVTVYAEIKKGMTIQRDSQYKDTCVYLSDVGQRKHDEAESHKGRPLKYSDSKTLSECVYWIKEKKYSPEAAVYKVGCKEMCVKTLYNYIHKGYVKGLSVYNLPYARPKKQKKTESVKRPFSRGKSIEERPAFIADRNTYGHWEMDTVYSSRDDKTCLLVLSERMSRQEIVVQIPDRTCKSVLAGLKRLERNMGAPTFRRTFKTITADNGMEFADWQSIEKSTLNKGRRTEVYFCHPYSSSERGTNENINRMIRRWIPKGDDIGLYSRQEIQDIQDWINDYPRGIFAGLSSNEYRKLIQERCVNE